MGEKEFNALKAEDLPDLLKKEVRSVYKERERQVGKEELEHLERFIMLQIIDDKWVAHLQSMDHMKEGVGLRGYGQLDPLKEYQKEGFALFGELMDQIREETVSMLFRVQIVIDLRSWKRPFRNEPFSLLPFIALPRLTTTVVICSAVSS